MLKYLFYRLRFFSVIKKCNDNKFVNSSQVILCFNQLFKLIDSKAVVIHEGPGSPENIQSNIYSIG